MSDRDTIIDKIKKLLRMKRGGTPDEIATALRLAQELADKHGIDLDGVNPDEESIREKPIAHEDAVCGARVSWECRYASLVCDQFFNIRVFKTVDESHTKYVLRFVGEEWDRMIALYVYRFLCGHFRREWTIHRGRCRNRKAFLWGMYLGLCQKLRDRQPQMQEAGIVLADRALARRDDYIAKNWGQLKTSKATPDGDASAARYRGWLAGRATEIHSGVKGAAGTNAALPATEGTRLLA